MAVRAGQTPSLGGFWDTPLGVSALPQPFGACMSWGLWARDGIRAQELLAQFSHHAPSGVLGNGSSQWV